MTRTAIVSLGVLLWATGASGWPPAGRGELQAPASPPAAQTSSSTQPLPAQPSPTQPPAPPAVPAPSATPPQAAAPPPDAAQLLLFGSDVGVVIHPIKPDKAADFELVVERLREALRLSENPLRQQQAASLKVLKAAEPGPAGAVLYVFLMEPPVKNVDYTVSRILAEAYPLEVDALWTKLRDAYAGPMHRLSLQAVQPTPPATPPSR